MQEVVASVKRVTDIMGEITAASQEQASGVERVNRAVSQMDEVTQQNAALVEEAAAAAGSGACFGEGGRGVPLERGCRTGRGRWRTVARARRADVDSIIPLTAEDILP